MTDSAESDRPDRHIGPDSRKVSHTTYCGSIQCAECYPTWGEAYNATRPTPSEVTQ